jgi:hypothetical protein
LVRRLQKLGWKDGKNIRIDYRWGNGDPDRIQEFAKELVELQPRLEVGLQQVSTEGYQHGPGQDYPIEEFIRPKQFADQQVQAADHHCERQNEKRELSHGETVPANRRARERPQGVAESL